MCSLGRPGIQKETLTFALSCRLEQPPTKNKDQGCHSRTRDDHDDLKNHGVMCRWQLPIYGVWLTAYLHMLCYCSSWLNLASLPRKDPYPSKLHAFFLS